MKVGEFVTGLHEALSATDEASKSAGASLDNWLVTVASALLAIPAVIGEHPEFGSRWVWGLFMTAEFALLASVILVIVRSQLFVRRLDRNAAHMLEVRAMIEHLDPGDPMPAPKPEWERRLERVVAERGQERCLATLALAAFLFGIILLTAVMIVRTWPARKSQGDHVVLGPVCRAREPPDTVRVESPYSGAASVGQGCPHLTEARDAASIESRFQ